MNEPITVKGLKEILNSFDKSGFGDILIIHSNNTVNGVELVKIDDNNYLRLKGLEEY